MAVESDGVDAGDGGDDADDDDDEDGHPNFCATELFLIGEKMVVEIVRELLHSVLSSNASRNLSGFREPHLGYSQPQSGNPLTCNYSDEHEYNASGGDWKGLVLCWWKRYAWKLSHRLPCIDHYIVISSATSISKDIEECKTSWKDRLVLTREMPSSLIIQTRKPSLPELPADVVQISADI